ncbi:penicillin acylase [Achromobacter denitrificans]|uniref:penicillin G acylase n=1 Tax=Achromobacter denitrificans TaxID=32002 RepID=UPI000F51193C|nr:penicillin G acylase [Achromobacter denitrificans]MBV2159202.1 penicillin acylase family protein [Achromobacter denitrificans]MDX3878459.1 penicillin G acylase [Achromobacter sp.]QCS66520.1 penicillin acylase [Achromobacter denitrificans]WFC66038.1 penicillin acylase [Achromobacter denitrificans]
MKQHLLSAAILAACAAMGAQAQAQEIQQKSQQRAEAAARPAGAVGGQVTIRRDGYGMPHVYANTVYGIFYGYGYAVAQDRLFQMEMARRSTQGRVAEVLGQSMVAFDKSIRGNFSPERIQRQLAALPASDRQILDGYAAGMNAWIARVRAEPGSLMPKEFNDLGFKPGDWTAYDVAMVFVGTMANRFSDANSELDNLALLTALKDRHGEERAMQIFNQLRWMTDSRAPVTVPEEEGRYQPEGGRPPARLSYALPRYDGTPPMLERVARDARTRGVVDESPADARKLLLAQFAESGQPGIAGFPTTSNMWIVGREHAKDARSILLNGPQFGWWNPAYTYGIGLHGAGFDVVGNTPFAYPSILFGHNAHVTWGSTAGFGDDVDIYAEKLDPADRTRYFHDGAWKTMEKRTELIEVKDAEPVMMDVYRTVHGIVTKFDEKQGVAYAKARAWEGYELQSLMAWTHKAQSRDWNEWKRQAARHALTINWYYADDRGNIGYAHTGFYPKRRPGHDPRLPVPGTGEMDWDGMLPFSTNPQVYNPRQGFIANWNNQPMRGYPSTDLFAIVWGQADRYAEIETRLKAMTADGGKVSAQQMWDLIRTTSYADVNRRHFLPFLRQAVQGLPADDARARMVAGLASWDGMGTSEKQPGFYDNAGPAVMDAWLRAMLKRTLADEMPADFFKWYSATGYPTPAAPATGSVNLTVGTKVLYNALAGRNAGVPQQYDFFNGQPPQAVTLAALDDALAALREAYGQDPAGWRVPAPPMVFAPKNFLGVPQADAKAVLSAPATQNRGTENNMTVFDARGVRAVDVVAPGQSGFVAPDGTASPHARDQFDLYASFGSKRVWFTEAEVRANAKSVETLRY